MDWRWLTPGCQKLTSGHIRVKFEYEKVLPQCYEKDK